MRNWHYGLLLVFTALGLQHSEWGLVYGIGVCRRKYKNPLVLWTVFVHFFSLFIHKYVSGKGEYLGQMEDLVN